MEEEALGRTLWRTRWGRGYGLIRVQAAVLRTESIPRPSPSQSTVLQSLFFTPSSLYPVPLVSGWLMAVHPVDVCSQLETFKINCQKYLIFVTWEKPGHQASRTEFYGTPGHSPSEPIKPKLSRGGELDDLPPAVFHGVNGSWAGFRWFRVGASGCLL